jgi:hypothetical protein
MVVLLVGGMLLVSCGGDADTAQDGGATALVVEDQDEGSAGDPAAALDEDPVGDELGDEGEGAGGSCFAVLARWGQAQAEVAEAMSSAMTGGPSDLESLEAGIRAMADGAPAEIRDAMQVYAREIGGYFAALAEIGYEFGETPTQEQMEAMSALGEAMDSEALDAASQEIEAYFAACD